MKKVVVFGAGMVAGAHVRYLLDHGLQVTVASRTVSKAEELVKGHPNGRAVAVNSDDTAALEAIIREHDLAVSLLPYAYHPVVARLCIKHGVHMVTTSYVKQVMADMDAEAKAAGVILLNEIGVDPGIDHMTAMRVIHKVQGQGGKIAKFISWCGGLPAPEANDNPFGYKFSWSPRGVLLAGKNSAQYLWDGEMVVIADGELFDHHCHRARGSRREADRLRGLPQPRQPALHGDLRHPGHPHDVPRHAAQHRLVRHPAQDRQPGPAGRSPAVRSGRRHLGRPHPQADRRPRRPAADLAAFLNVKADSRSSRT